MTFFAFNLSKNGRTVYTSAASGWVFDTAAIPDASVPALGDARLGLRVFTLRPNWSFEVIERVSFFTEVLESETDIEQRRSLRIHPRRSFEASFMRTKRDRTRLQSFLTGIGNDRFLVPLWHEQWTLQDSFGLTVEFPADTAAQREFQPGTLALLSGRDAAVYEIVRVETLDPLTDRVTFSRPQTPINWTAGTKLTPLRVAKITDATQLENPTDSVGMTTLRFDLIEPDTYFLPDWRYCVPLWQFPINWSQSVNLDFSRLTYDIDNNISVPDNLSPGERTRVVTRANVLLRGRSNVYGFRQFITAARGRQVSFWFPSALNDLQPIGDIGGLYFDVEKSGIGEYVRTPQDVNRTVMIRFKGDERPPIFRFVTGVESLQFVDRVFVQVSLPAARKDDIEEISFVHPVRFEQDAFELRHLVNDSAAVSTSVVVRSTEVGDLPPIECVVTSQPYPVEEIEALSVGMTLSSVFESGFRWPSEGIGIGMAFTQGALISALKTYDNYAPEALNAGMVFSAATVQSSIRSLVIPAEALNIVSMSFSGGTLQQVLVPYNNYPAEAINVVGMTFTAGTLT